MRASIFTALDVHEHQSIVEAYTQLHQQVEHAESLGFNGAWVAEHHFRRIGCIPNPAVVLSSLSQVTSHIRLGSAVAVLPLRDAREVAEDYAMVDILSGGRLNMGVGAGASKLEFEQAGVSFADRRDLFETHLTQLKSNWQTSTPLNIAPVQSPSPPIYVATSSPGRAYQAGLAGDSVLSLVSPGTEDLSNIAAIAKAHRTGQDDAPRRQTNSELVVAVFAHIADNDEEGLGAAGELLRRFFALAGASQESDGIRMCQQMTRQGTALFGSAPSLRSKISRYQDLGVEHLAFICQFGGANPDQVRGTQQYIADVLL